MLLSELLNTMSPIQVTGQNNDVVSMEFNLRGKEYMFSGSNDTWEEDVGESWNIDFGLYQNNDTDYELTGTGNMYEVLATVKQCVFKLLQMRPNITQIVFTGNKQEPSRIKLYDRLLRMIKIPGWSSRKEVGGGRDFYIFFKDN